MSVYLSGHTIHGSVNNMDGNAELVNFIYQNLAISLEPIKQKKERLKKAALVSG